MAPLSLRQILLLILIGSGPLGLAVAESPFSPTFAEYRREIRGYRDKDLPNRLAETELTEFFAPLSSLVSGQPTFTFLKLLDNIREAEHRYNVGFDGKEFQLDHDGGRSVYPLARRLKVIRYRKRLFIIDGHHKALTSLYFGAKTAPVQVMADWSDLSRKEFRDRMVKSGYAYPLDHKGRPTDNFYLLNSLRDEPRLYLARLLTYKIKLDLRFGALVLLDHSGFPDPLVLKINEDVPFLEFYIAEALRQSRVDYDPAWGDHVPLAVRRQVREVLVKALQDPQSPLHLAVLLTGQVPVQDLDKSPEVRRRVLDLLLDHFRKRSLCDDNLLGRTKS